MHVPDDERNSRLKQALMAGTPAKDACLYAGISHEDYTTWRSRGRAHQAALSEADPDTPEALDADAEEAPFLAFLTLTDEALAAAKVQCTVAVSGAIRNGEWRAAAWMLERLDPENFGRKMLQPVNPDGSALPGDVDTTVGRLWVNLRQNALEQGWALPSDPDDEVADAEIVGEEP